MKTSQTNRTRESSHLSFLQVAGDETTVIQAVLACDVERSQLLKEEQNLLRQLNKESPDGAQPSQAATANGNSATTASAEAATPAASSATASGESATANGKPDLPNGSAAGESRDNNGAVGGKETESKAADAAESKAATQLAQVGSPASAVPFSIPYILSKLGHA